ncbi:hypothetical protein ABW19_dt0203479 [Dactylella cylindrospora]|nr:hypothetical protein ABW19_dt0203479 [Dactylella cylindrospora]
MNYPIGPRLHLFEIDDQTWFPQYLRERIQACLTFCWSFSFKYHFIKIGPSASSTLARVLFQELGSSLSSYTFIDFCAGAGGPTPVLEKHVNGRLRNEGLEEVEFVLTDLWPNVKAWRRIAADGDAKVRWVEEPVDAGKAPKKEVLLGYGGSGEMNRKKNTFRMFSLAFHHFDDDGAKRILKDAVGGSDAIGIFEIQSRTLSGFFQVFMIGPLLTFLGPLHPPFWNLGHMFFTYIIPILPFVMVFDGYMSAWRTRTPKEIMELIETIDEKDRDGWEWRWGRRGFAGPIGEINYFIGVKKSGESTHVD